MEFRADRKQKVETASAAARSFVRRLVLAERVCDCCRQSSKISTAVALAERSRRGSEEEKITLAFGLEDFDLKPQRKADFNFDFVTHFYLSLSLGPPAVKISAITPSL